MYGLHQVYDAMGEASKRQYKIDKPLPLWKLQNKHTAGVIKITVLVTYVKTTPEYLVVELASGKQKWIKRPTPEVDDHGVTDIGAWPSVNIDALIVDCNDVYITATVNELRKRGLLEKS